MDTAGVTETGAPGAGNPSRGDRDGATEVSGFQDPGGICPRRERHAGTATPERGAPSDGGGDGRVFPSLPHRGAGGTGGRVFPPLPPQGAGGVDGGVFPSLPPEGAGGVGGRDFQPPPLQGVEGGAGGEFPPPPPPAPGRRDQAVSRLPWGPYGLARAAGPPRTPPRGGGDRAPAGAQDAAAISAALRDSLDALISPLHDRLSLIETALGTTRRSRRRRRRISSSSCDGEYSGGDGGRHVPRRSVTRALGHELGGESHRRIPPKIVPADDRYAAVLDCANCALANTDIRYDRTMAHGLRRLRKDVSATFDRDAEWDGTPALGVFEFLSRFVKAGDDNDVSEGRALYLLLEFTEGDLKRELYTIMPSLQGGRSGKVSSYLKLINWLLRKYADEQSLSDQDALFHGAAQGADETENEYYERLRGLRRLCGNIHTEGQMKSRYMQGLGWQIRADVREHNTPSMPMDLLVQYAQRNGDVCRRRLQEKKDEEDRRAEARRVRRAARPAPRKNVTAAVTAPRQVGEVPPGPSRWGPTKVGEVYPPRRDPPKVKKVGPSRWGAPKVKQVPQGQAQWASAKVGEGPRGPSSRTSPKGGEAGRPGRPRTNDCLACNMRGHFFRECPRLDAGTKALLTKAFLERCEERRRADEEVRKGQPVAAVREHYGPPWSSSDDSPSPERDAAEKDEEANSPSGNE